MPSSTAGRAQTLSYRDARDLLDAVYASGLLQFLFEPILLFGY
jgi:hypothetical protein